MLVDIGSAVLSVRAILAGGDVDGIDVRLADAPLVEGAVAAAVLAADRRRPGRRSRRPRRRPAIVGKL